MTGDVAVSTREEAVMRADRIRGHLADAYEEVLAAVDAADWLALGYDSVRAWWAAEFADTWTPPRLPAAERREVVRGLTDQGLEQADVASIVGVSDRQVRRDLDRTCVRSVSEPAVGPSSDTPDEAVELHGPEPDSVQQSVRRAQAGGDDVSSGTEPDAMESFQAYLGRENPAALDRIARARLKRLWAEAVSGFAGLLPLSPDLLAEVVGDDDLASARLAHREAGKVIDRMSQLRRPGLRVVGGDT